MLALLAAGEWSFGRIEMDVIAPWHWDWRLAGGAATSKAKTAEVLCFGDSQLKFSVLPVVMDVWIEKRSYNLAMPLGQPPASYFLLRRAVRAGARPRAVLIDATPHLIRESPLAPSSLRQWPELLSVAEMVDLAWTARDPRQLAALGAAKMLPTLRAREEIRTALTSALRGEVSGRRFLAAQFWRNSRVNRGATAMGAGEVQEIDAAAACNRLYAWFGCDPLNAVYLDRFIALAVEHKIAVYYVIPPLMDEAQKLCEASGFDAKHGAFVADLQRRFPELRVIDGRYAGYGRELYTSDPVHMNYRGAAAFSEQVGRALAQEGQMRWAALPRYRAGFGARAAVEDVGESAMMLKPRGRSARR